MDAAISGQIERCLEARLRGQDPQATPQAAPVDWRDDWFIYCAPDLSDEAAAEVTQAGAWPAWNSFWRLLWKKTREADKALRRAVAANANEKTIHAKAAALAKLRAAILEGEGVKGLCRSISVKGKFKACPKAMNRQFMEMQVLGIFAVDKPPSVIERDAKGKIVRRPTHKGYVPPSTIRFIGGDRLRRPANRQGANRPLRAVGPDGRQGAIHHLPPVRSKGRSATTPISPKNISPQEGGHADGIGRPSWGAGRLPAAVGDAPPLRAFTGEDHDRFEATKRRLAAQEAEESRRQAESDRIFRERHAAKAKASPNATEAARSLQQAVEELPPASAEKAKKVARKLTKAERKAEADARRLREIIEKKRAAESENPRAAAETMSQAAREASRKARAAAREPMPAG